MFAISIFIEKFVKSYELKNVFLFKKCLDFFLMPIIVQNFKNIPICPKKCVVIFQKIKILKKAFDKCSKFEKYFVLAICGKIESNVGIKETHFLKFF